MKKKYFLIIAYSLLFQQSCQTTDFNEVLSSELIEMAKADQDIRNYISINYPLGKITDESIKQKWDSIDLGNLKRLKEIIKVHDWPGYNLVGKEGSNAAWIIAQHADSDLEFQKLALLKLEEAVKNNNANPQALAYLKDRVLVLQRLPQIYGTQIDWLSEDSPKPYPIKNEDQVDKLRLNIGLDSLNTYLKEF